MIKMNIRDIYKGKRVFLTGHTGFKGSWLLTWLHDMGAVVKGYALDPKSGNELYTDIKGDELCESVIADIRDAERLSAEMKSFKPDFVFHLAAQPLVRLSYSIPVETFAVNAMGTAHVLEAMRQLEHPCTGVMITTDKVYENPETGVPFKEDDKLGGHDPYSASKAAAEIVISSYRSSFFQPSKIKDHGISISSARAGNVIGGGDMAEDRIIPDIIRALISDRKISIRNPKATRPWEHVMEPLQGYLLLGALQHSFPGTYEQCFNFGPHPDHTKSVEVLAKGLLERWGDHTDRIELDSTPQPKEASLLNLDITKAGQQLGWTPRLSFEETVNITTDWYRDRHINGMDARGIMQRDIRYFENLS
jgi:CDP-glucose 4,6-dehydratase